MAGGRTPVTTEPGSYLPGNFTSVRKPELFVTKEDVLNAIDDENVIIIDSFNRRTL